MNVIDCTGQNTVIYVDFRRKRRKVMPAQNPQKTARKPSWYESLRKNRIQDHEPDNPPPGAA